MYVIATAGHVDHGKSSLARALTGMEPDRWEEERRRGLTIDLGFTWTTLPAGARLAIVDVPGHERFIANTLAGLGPVPAVMLVVSLYEGWQAQTTEHLAAIDALGIGCGVVAATFADTVDSAEISARLAEIRQHLNNTTLAHAPIVPVSAHTGEGLEELRASLEAVLTTSLQPPAAAVMSRLRLWVDRAFSIKGAGCVVTGTLAHGSLHVGDELTLIDAYGTQHDVTVRGLQEHNLAQREVEPYARVAVNVRGISAGAISRGAVLIGRNDTWWQSTTIDVSAVSGLTTNALPQQLQAHVGSLSVTVHVRPLRGNFIRLTFTHAIPPLQLLDRVVLRGPGVPLPIGCEVIDLDPPPLRRRGDAARRATFLQTHDPRVATDYVRRKEAVVVAKLRGAGFAVEKPPAGIIAFQQWWVSARAVTRWKTVLRTVYKEYLDSNPLADALPVATALSALGLPEGALLSLAIAAAGLTRDGAVLRDSAAAPRDLGPAEQAVSEVEQRLAKNPFAAPEASELAALGLSKTELAAAERAGRLVRVGSGIVLRPQAITLARTRLASLGEDFTLSQARQVLGTTRRVAVPLLEYMDAQKITVRVDGSLRRLR